MKIAVLVSGGGTNLQAIIDKVENGTIRNTSIEVVISNKKDAYALTRAKEHNIPGEYLSPKDFDVRDEFNQALVISKGFNGYVDSNRAVSDEDIEVARATWITLLQSRNGMRRNWKGMKVGNEEAIYLNKLVRKYDLPRRLKNVTVTNRDALEILKEIKDDEDAMIYLDPPYTFHERTSNNLYQCEQDDEKQKKMVELIKDAKAHILVSGYKNPIYDQVLNEANGWTSKLLMEVVKHSSSRRGIKPVAQEWIWKNY